MPRVEAGQRALLRPDAYPERSLEAVVDSITPKGDPVTKTYRVRLALPETTPLLIGMTVEVVIVVDARPGACCCRPAPSWAIPSTSSNRPAVRAVASSKSESAAPARSRSSPESTTPPG
jgi:hypothetical protein